MALTLWDFLTSANNTAYALRYASLIADPCRFFLDYRDAEIDRPVFLLGTSGGGLTLISRMLRRNRRVVSVSGNYRYWSGPDEMAVVLGSELPFQLGGVKHKLPEHPLICDTANWRYGCDDMLGLYRRTRTDANEELRRALRQTIGWALFRHGDGGARRFTDKSQVYTVKAAFIDELLAGCGARFILVTRNPYAVCYRAPSRTALSRLEGLSFEDRLEVACQHWANSMRCALRDGGDLDHFMAVRFEDILTDPVPSLKRICEFTDLEFSRRMVPTEESEMPFGSRFRDGWYPLRADVNERYLARIDAHSVATIEHYCGRLAEQFGYEKPC